MAKLLADQRDQKFVLHEMFKIEDPSMMTINDKSF
jgi:hypothetical protein